MCQIVCVKPRISWCRSANLDVRLSEWSAENPSRYVPVSNYLPERNDISSTPHRFRKNPEETGLRGEPGNKRNQWGSTFINQLKVTDLPQRWALGAQTSWLSEAGGNPSSENSSSSASEGFFQREGGRFILNPFNNQY